MRRQRQHGRLAALLVLVAAALLHAAPSADSSTFAGAVEKNARVARALAPSVVVVEYFLRYDKGQPPEDLQLAYERENGRFDITYDMGRTLMREERPLQQEGFVLAPDTVLTRDRGIHARFVEQVRVRYGDTSVVATPVAYARSHDAVLLALQKPLEGVEPIRFDTTARVAHAVNSVLRDGCWSLRVAGVSSTVLMRGETPIVKALPNTLLVDSAGTVAGLVMNGEVRATPGAQRDPAAWSWVSADHVREHIERLRDMGGHTLVHVLLSMRSPKKTGGQLYGGWQSSSGLEENISATEAHAVGVCLTGGRVLVLTNLSAEATARLERIEVYAGADEPFEARFVGNLADYGAMLVKVDSLSHTGIALAEDDIQGMRHRLLLKARVAMAGKQRIAHYWPGRLRTFVKGFRGTVCPEAGVDVEGLFLFSPEGTLLALPIVPRRKVVADQESMWGYDQMPIMPVSVLQPILADPGAHFDTSNVPLDEAREGRLAWMGVVLQPLDMELARANGVAEQTNDGESGALVSYVYEKSPADKAGITPGMILLRIDAADQPRPINVRVQEASLWNEPFPWDQIESLPEEYLDRIPPPWPAADNSFARSLTELGFGVGYRADFMDQGHELQRRFMVVESPPHYSSAPRYESESLGLTVRDITFEVRRYYQKEAGEPGVVVSKVRAGGKASVAGIKPFELITHLNGRRVSSVEQFGSLMKEGDEVKLSVERMGRSRQVRIELGS